jgi:rhodanese-related sulfurtransferase
MRTQGEISRITAREAEQKRGEALLLDVRTPAEFEEMHIPGAILHPLSGLQAEEVRRLAEGKSACILVCRSGARATEAAKKLLSSGLETPCVLEGGVMAWEAAGYEVARGRKTISLERQVRIAAGTLVLSGVLLGTFVNPLWLVLSGFVGAGLIFAGITDTCGMGMLLARMPWNSRSGRSCACKQPSA